MPELKKKRLYNRLLCFIINNNILLQKSQMTQAIVNLDEYEDRVINIVKGKYGLKNKSEAINFIIEKFEQQFLEPELKPEYIEKVSKIEKQKAIRIGSIEDFKKRY